MMIAEATRQQFASTMLEVGRQDPRLVVLVSDITHFKLQPFAQACPNRYYNVGICEPAIVGMSAGLAKVGFIPVTHTITPFLLERSLEQIKLDYCYQKLAGNLVSVGSAFDYSSLGCTHHCYNDFSLLSSLPNVNLFYPSSPVEFDTLFRRTYDNGCLNYYRVPAHSHEKIFDPVEIKPGVGVKITNGSDLTIVVTGPQLKSALEACALLKEDGWSPEVIYIHTIQPLDTYLITHSVRKTKRLLVIEEHTFHGGLGHRILSAIKDINFVQSSFLCIPPQFMTNYGSYRDQCQRIDLTCEGILRRVQEEFLKKQS